MGSELRRCHSDPGLSRSNYQRPNKMTLNDALNYLKAVKCAFAENSDSYKNFLQFLRDFKNHARQSDKTENDAQNYLKAVRREFAGNSDSYDNFLQIMKDFKNKIISIEEVVRRVEALFRWHPNLILGFNQFLPIDYKINLLSPVTAVAFSDAMSYVTKIKDRFRDEKYIYTTFLNILRSCKKVEMMTQDVIDEVRQLFRDHPDLMEEFLQFIPAPQPDSLVSF